MYKKSLTIARIILLVICVISLGKIIITLLGPPIALFASKPFYLLEYVQQICVYGGLIMVYLTWSEKRPTRLFILLGLCLVLMPNLGYVFNFFQFGNYPKAIDPLAFSLVRFVIAVLITITMIIFLMRKPKSIPLIGYVIFYTVRSLSFLATIIVMNTVDIFNTDMSLFQTIGDIAEYGTIIVLLMALIINGIYELMHLKGFRLFSKSKTS